MENTPLGGLRSLFIEEGLVTYVTSYHKGFNISNKLKIINRYFPKEVSLVLVYYLAKIRPFIGHLHYLAQKKAPIGPQLWFKSLGGFWSSDNLSKVWEKESLKELGPGTRLIIAFWRHIAIAISREHLPKGFYFDKANPIDHSLKGDIDSQAGHHPLMADTTYGRLFNEFQGQTRPKRERYRRISILWHLFWLENGPISPPKALPPLEEPLDDPLDDDNPLKAPLDPSLDDDEFQAIFSPSSGPSPPGTPPFRPIRLDFLTLWPFPP